MDAPPAPPVPPPPPPGNYPTMTNYQPQNTQTKYGTSTFPETTTKKPDSEVIHGHILRSGVFNLIGALYLLAFGIWYTITHHCGRISTEHTLSANCYLFTPVICPVFWVTAGILGIAGGAAKNRGCCVAGIIFAELSILMALAVMGFFVFLLMIMIGFDAIDAFGTEFGPMMIVGLLCCIVVLVCSIIQMVYSFKAILLPKY